jgi:hypothetical protein
MAAPLVGIAVAAAARLAAKKIAQEAAKKAAAKKTAQIASNSVKPVKAGSAYAKTFNQGSMMKATDAATGAAAKKGAARLGVTGKKGVQPPVKINSGAKSTPATKAGTKAIKAANKPTRASRTRSGNKAK